MARTLYNSDNLGSQDLGKTLRVTWQGAPGYPDTLLQGYLSRVSHGGDGTTVALQVGKQTIELNLSRQGGRLEVVENE